MKNIVMAVSIAALTIQVHSQSVAALENQSSSSDNAGAVGASAGVAIGMSFFGMLATILGASIPLIFFICRRKCSNSESSIGYCLPKNITCGFFAFSGGAIVFGVIYDLLPSCITYFKKIHSVRDSYATIAALSTFTLGIGLYYLLDHALMLLIPDHNYLCHSHKFKCVCENSVDCNCEYNAQLKHYRNLSYMALIASTLHHIPEGIIFYASVVSDFKVGTIIGLILLIHVFPEGLSIGSPTLVAFPSQPWRGPLYGAIAGFGQPLGSIIAYAILSYNFISDTALAIIIGLSSGFMITISVKGFLFTACSFDPHDKVVSINILMGMIFIFFTFGIMEILGFDA